MPDKQPTAPSTCELFSAGHQVHWIQALRTANSSEVAALSWRGRVVQLDGTQLEVEPDDGGETVVLANHDPERLARLVGLGPVKVNDTFAILRAGGYCFSVTRGALAPCQPLSRVTSRTSAGATPAGDGHV